MRLIHGNQGGLFFLSTHSWGDWRTSLEFYKGVTFQARCKRLILLGAYLVVPSTCRRNDMADRMEAATGCRPDVSQPCSGIISPTGDKAVVHIHGRGYWKAAGGRSYPKVKAELTIYRLFQERRPVLFGYSEVSDVHDDGEHLSFFMREESGVFAGDVHRPLEAVLPALEEFHALRPEGLVHGDFKPWNVRWRRDGRPHFFDFEEAHTGDIREDIEHYQSLGGMRR